MGGDRDPESLDDRSHLDEDPAAEADGIELTGADELVASGAAHGEEAASLGDGENAGTRVGAHALLSLFTGQNLTSHG